MTEKIYFNKTCPIYLVFDPFHNIQHNISSKKLKTRQSSKKKMNLFLLTLYWLFYYHTLLCFVLFCQVNIYFILSYDVISLQFWSNNKFPCLKPHTFSNIHVYTRSWNDRRARHGGSTLSTKMLVRRQSPRELSQLCIWLCLCDNRDNKCKRVYTVHTTYQKQMSMFIVYQTEITPFVISWICS